MSQVRSVGVPFDGPVQETGVTPEFLPPTPLRAALAASRSTAFRDASSRSKEIDMLCLEGNPISPGFASGVAVVRKQELVRSPVLCRRTILRSDVQSEYERIDDALAKAKHDLNRAAGVAASEPKLADAAALLSVHAAMASEITALAKEQINCDLVGVEHALDSVIRDWVSRLEKLDNDYLRQREQDIRDVGQRMAQNLAGIASLDHERLPPGSVIITSEVLPSETIELAKSGAVAIICEHGGKLSHTAIIARSLGIPAVSGIAEVTSKIPAGVLIQVDGTTGQITVEPSVQQQASFCVRRDAYCNRVASLACQASSTCRTSDGVEIAILGNVGLPEEAELIEQYHLGGIGLFRTEFLCLQSHQRPTSDTQTHIYQTIAERLNGLPIVIRTFDLGGDKLPSFLLHEDSTKHNNLHLRGLRYSLTEKDLLDDQLHAIIQIAQASDVRILFPMVVGVDDFTQAIAAVDRAVERLDVLHRPPIGVMIETPAALFALDEILDLADFVAIGTNDLTQYMLAADRDLSTTVNDCTAMHPAVLRAIKQVVDKAGLRGCPVCVCGEEAGDPDFACLLVGLGIRELSLSPFAAAEVRRAISRIDSQQAAEIAQRALACHSPAEVRELLPALEQPAPRSELASICQP